MTATDPPIPGPRYLAAELLTAAVDGLPFEEALRIAGDVLEAHAGQVADTASGRRLAETMLARARKDSPA